MARWGLSPDSASARSNVNVKSLMACYGYWFPLPKNGIVIIVVPSKADKRHTIRDIAKIVNNAGESGVVVNADVDY